MSEQTQVNVAGLFETATRKKLRWSRPNGAQLFNLEDLWDLSLEQLDSIAVTLHKQMKETNEISFISQSKTSAATAELTDKFNVVKYILDVKLAEQTRAVAAKERREAKQKLLALIDRKQNEQLEGKSLDELKAELEALDD